MVKMIDSRIRCLWRREGGAALTRGWRAADKIRESASRQRAAGMRLVAEWLLLVYSGGNYKPSTAWAGVEEPLQAKWHGVASAPAPAFHLFAWRPLPHMMVLCFLSF